ncbi:MAG: flavin reductase [Chitinophaga sp.]|jgi:flavin reductase (DIM6/NTAB) family NADH-FMN oxidoreductase RutF|nr:flavin reductase [Chitinophaga sp.]
MKTINIQELPFRKRQAWLQYAVAPRPIAFASTIDKAGNVNLSPFSFFNLFSTNPPIVIFSPSRSGRNNTLKHTLINVLEVPEVVINICDYNMVQQVSLSSCEYAKEVDEFIKAGFTKQAATIIQPPMVKEAKIKMECKVNEVKSLGDEGGAGQLVIAEVLCMHVDDSILNEDATMIDPFKMQHVARLGGDYYALINEQNLFTVAKPNTELAIGIDALPEGIKNSKILTGNHLGQLANVQQLPEVDVAFEDVQLKNIIQYYSINPDEMEKELHRYASVLLDQGKVKEAWQVLLADENV